MIMEKSTQSTDYYPKQSIFFNWRPIQSQKTQGFCVAFEFEGLARSKILGILQTESYENRSLAIQSLAGVGMYFQILILGPRAIAKLQIFGYSRSSIIFNLF